MLKHRFTLLKGNQLKVECEEVVGCQLSVEKIITDKLCDAIPGEAAVQINLFVKHVQTVN